MAAIAVIALHDIALTTTLSCRPPCCLTMSSPLSLYVPLRAIKPGCRQGIETLLEDMVKADVEWSKLGQIPGLVDGWTDVKDKVGIATEEFKAGSTACHVSPSHLQLKHESTDHKLNVVLS